MLEEFKKFNSPYPADVLGEQWKTGFYAKEDVEERLPYDPRETPLRINDEVEDQLEFEADAKEVARQFQDGRWADKIKEHTLVIGPKRLDLRQGVDKAYASRWQMPSPYELQLITFRELYAAHLKNLQYQSYHDVVVINAVEKAELWLSSCYTFLNHEVMVYHLTNPYYFNEAMAKEVLISVDYFRGYRALLARVNLYLAALEAQEPFDLARVAVETLGEVVPSGLKKHEVTEFKLAHGDSLGPSSPRYYLDLKFKKGNIGTDLALLLYELNDWADDLYTHNPVFQAFVLAYRRWEKYLQDPRHLLSKDPEMAYSKAFSALQWNQFKLLEGLFRNFDLLRITVPKGAYR